MVLKESNSYSLALFASCLFSNLHCKLYVVYKQCFPKDNLNQRHPKTENIIKYTVLEYGLNTQSQVKK